MPLSPGSTKFWIPHSIPLSPTWPQEKDTVGQLKSTTNCLLTHLIFLPKPHLMNHKLAQHRAWHLTDIRQVCDEQRVRRKIAEHQGELCVQRSHPFDATCIMLLWGRIQCSQFKRKNSTYQMNFIPSVIVYSWMHFYLPPSFLEIIDSKHTARSPKIPYMTDT